MLKVFHNVSVQVLLLLLKYVQSRCKSANTMHNLYEFENESKHWCGWILMYCINLLFKARARSHLWSALQLAHRLVRQTELHQDNSRRQQINYGRHRVRAAADDSPSDADQEKLFVHIFGNVGWTLRKYIIHRNTSTKRAMLSAND